MLSRFFLNRPVFAWVIAILIMVFGGLAIHQLPISQYPPIAPPSIRVGCLYPGASAETVENSITQIIEQQMTGLDRLLYLSGSSDSSGISATTLTFAPGTDPDIAWAKVQNKLQMAMAKLPDVVQRRGVNVRKSTNNYLLIVGLISEDGSMTDIDLRDYALSTVQHMLARVPGVGEVEGFGGEYAMRIWFNPDKLTSFSLTINDLKKALQTYNVEISGGQFGGTPARDEQGLNAAIIVRSLLKTPEEFANIPVRINPDGSIVRIRDVARTELGCDLSDTSTAFNGLPAAALSIRKEPGANALETAAAIKAKMEELSRHFPPGMKVIYPYDTTPFTKVSIQEVVKTLFEAIGLVFVVIFLFMGNLRATLIPTIAVPVVLLGTFAMLAVAGFSINMLTMFAMVLAIGLLVDDAIVVVENVERIMSEEGLSPKAATAKSMDQITPALIGIGLVLAAVFGPMAFFSGSTGVIYRQFSITVVAAMLLSVAVALILTPVLCASILKPITKGSGPAGTGAQPLRPFFKVFDHVFSGVRDFFLKLVGHTLAHKLRYLVLFLAIVSAMVHLFMRLPKGYLPDEDQGLLMVQASLPAGSTLAQSKAVMAQVRNYFLNEERAAVQSCMTTAGQNQSGRGQNIGMAYIKLKDWKLRTNPELRANAIIGRATRNFSKIRTALIHVFAPPPVIELGSAKGVDFQLQDRRGLGHQGLIAARDQLLDIAAKDPRLNRVRINGLEDVPEYRIDVDLEKAGTLGVPLDAIHDTISIAFGGAYVNDFIKSGRVKHVDLQADAPYRMQPEDLSKLYVRNSEGEMVPYSTFASGHWVIGSPKLERFNAFPSINIQGEPAPGRSSGEAMQAMEEAVAKLSSQQIGFDWTGLSYQERQAGTQTVALYAFSVLAIFLCLAALYESWTVPVAILLTLPLGIIGGVMATGLRGLNNDVYFQIGLLTTMGLTVKNAILIVQFAKARVGQGMDLIEATLEGTKLRFRPIVMTSMAFGFGVLPMTLTNGAGAGAQHAIGTGVLGGMITATFLVILFAPLFYVLIQKTFGARKEAEPRPDGTRV